MRLALLILFCLLPSTAFAGQLIAVLGAEVIGSLTLGQILMTVGLAVYGNAKARRQERDAEEARRNAFNSGLQDRTVTNITTEAPFRRVYGRARVGSSILAIFTAGNKDQYKYLVCVHAAHECDGFEEVYLNRVALGALDANGWVTTGPYVHHENQLTNETHQTLSFNVGHTPVVSNGGYFHIQFNDPSGEIAISIEVLNFTRVGTLVTIPATITTTIPVQVEGAIVYQTAEYTFDLTNGYFAVGYTYDVATPRVRVSHHLGTPGDAADAMLMAARPDKWFSTSTVSGFCYSVVMLDLNEPEFQSGIPSVEVLLRGALLYDPRTTLTEWSENNALVLRDYLTCEFCAVPAADLDAASFITAANVCDEVESFGARYTFNGTIDSTERRETVLDRIADSMAGGIESTTWRVWAGKYVAPIMALTQEDIIGEASMLPGASEADLFNTIRGKYISDENDYVVTDYQEYKNSTYVTADGDELAHNIDYPYTNTTQRVHNLNRIAMESQRTGLIFKAQMSLKAMGLQVGDRATFTGSFFGQTDKIYIVLDKKEPPYSPVELTFKEDAEAIWDFADAVVLDQASNTDLENPYDINPLESLTCESGTDQLLLQADGTIISRILVTWPSATSQAVFTNGLIEVEWAEIGTDVWLKTTVTGSSTQVYLSPIQDGTFYVVRARTVNPNLNVKSDWIYSSSHQALGKTEPPDSITFFAVDADGIADWDHINAIDLAGYEIRWQPGNNRSWGDASPIHSGVLTESPYQIVIRPTGVATFMIKAVDFSGNYSGTAAACVVNLGDPIIDNIINSYDYKANDWPGTISGATVVGGDIVADADASALAWDPNPLTAGWTLDTDPGWTLVTYNAVEYLPDVYVVAEADDGAQLSLANTIVGTSFLISYRRDGDALGWTSDAEPGWTDDADPAWDVEAWRPWPGAVTAREGRYEWKITIQSRDVQGEITELTAMLDVVDQIEVVGLVSILAAGTVIPTSKTWRSIENISMNLVADGGTARSLRIEDTQARTVTARNSADAAVDGTALVTLQGY